MASFYPPTALVIVDPTVKDYKRLTDHVCPEASIVVLDVAQDGIEQITQALAAHHGLQSLHILSHGESGALYLGNARLSLASLDHYIDRLQSWATAIADQAEIFLYGCQVAAGTAGQRFVERLSAVLNTTVAASTTLVGSAELGGNWLLDFATGTVRHPLAFQPQAMAAYPHALQRVILSETFADDDVDVARWIFGVDEPGNPNKANPFLTARANPAAPAGGLPGNPAAANPSLSPPFPSLDTPNPTDPLVTPPEGGVLRLTNAVQDQAGFVLYDDPNPLTSGLVVEFDFYMYGGTGADGITFFLADGREDPDDAGAFGGSLGYAQRTGVPGLEGGIIGIGFDAFGNYSNPTEGRVGGIGFVPNAIAIRGSEEMNYEYLGGTGTLPFDLDVPGATTRAEAKRTARITITPTGLLSVQIDVNDDGLFTGLGETPAELQNVDIVDANGGLQLPNTFTFGFAAGTGTATNAHEIRNLVIRTFTDPPIVFDRTQTIAPTLPTVRVVGDTDIDPEDGKDTIGELGGTDADGTIAFFRILTLPGAGQGTLYLGDPATPGSIALTPENIETLQLTQAQINQLFFDPTPEFSGTAFTYTAVDNDGAPAERGTEGVVRLNLGPNESPTASDATFQIPFGATAAPLGTLQASDPDGTIASFTIETIPDATQGQLFIENPTTGARTPVAVGTTLTPDQAEQLVFVPGPGFGEEGTTFTFSATDNIGADSNLATITLEQEDGPVNTPPEAADFQQTVNPNVATAIQPFPVSDTDGTVEFVVISALPPSEVGQLFVGDPLTGGTPVEAGREIALDNANQLFFRPNPGFENFNVTFNYFAVDNADATSNTATATLVAGAVQEAGDPVADNFTIPVTNAAAVPVSFDGRVRDTNLDGSGSVTAVVIATLPPADAGQLFLGDPAAGGRPVTLGEIIPVDQANTALFFLPTRATGSDAQFTYFAIDNEGNLSGGGIPGTATAPEGAIVTLDFPGPEDPDCPPGVRRRGGGGNNSLRGTPDADTLIGGAGNDTLRGLGCDDTLEGGAGVDRLFGGPKEDILRGGRGNDTLRGQFGDDTINGGLGNDRSFGGRGSDFILTRRGNDIANGQAGNDTVVGNRGADTIRGGANNDVVQGRQNRDLINGGNGQDLVYGNLGADTVRGGKDFDRLFGGVGTDELKGQGASDVIFGDRGDDVIRGGSQRDQIIAGAGNDTIIGGGGPDIMSGGTGADTFVFNSIRHGGDEIVDFQPRIDRLDFSGIFRGPGYNPAQGRPFRYIQRVQVGSDTLLRLDSNGSGAFVDYLTLTNIAAGTLNNRNLIVV
ncbi:MAG: hypothetical protein Kow00121_08380 [Elainellaceae cyanobacterium]